MLEKNLKDLFNAGLGLFKLGEDKIQNILGDFEKNFNILKEKGEQDNSEAAVRLREILGRTLNDMKNVTTQAEKNFNSFIDEAKNNSSMVMQKLKNFVGEKNISDFNAKMEEIAKNIQKRPLNGHNTVDQHNEKSEEPSQTENKS